jgi:hypothetical protein
MVITSLEDFVKVFATAVADAVRASDPSLVNQNDPRGLRGRRHIEAVRRRMTEERNVSPVAKTAFKRGNEYLLTPVAAREELDRLSKPGLVSRSPEPPRKSAKAPKVSARDEMAKAKRELEAEMRREMEKRS